MWFVWDLDGSTEKLHRVQTVRPRNLLDRRLPRGWTASRQVHMQEPAKDRGGGSRSTRFRLAAQSSAPVPARNRLPSTGTSRSRSKPSIRRAARSAFADAMTETSARRRKIPCGSCAKRNSFATSISSPGNHVVLQMATAASVPGIGLIQYSRRADQSAEMTSGPRLCAGFMLIPEMGASAHTMMAYRKGKSNGVKD